MKKVIINDLNSLINLLSNLNYGSVFVKLEDKSLESDLLKYVELCNIKVGHGTIRLSDAVETDIVNGNYTDRVMEGWHSITWADRHVSPPVFTDDEYNIKGLAEKSVKERSIIPLNIGKEFAGLAKKIAKEVDVKFISNPSGIAFSGKSRGVSAYKQLEEVMMNGGGTVVFDMDDVNAQTIRVYASQISAFTGVKMSVSVADGKITVSSKNNVSPRLKSVNSLAEKTGSIYKQMQKAYTSGLASVSFDSNIVNAPTVRTYASQLGSSVGEKFGCSMDKNIITVHFKPAGYNELFKKWFSDGIEKYRDTVPVDFMLQVIREEFGVVISASARDEDDDPVWKQAGYSRPEEYEDYQRRLKADLDSWIRPGQEDENDGGHIDKVDGLDQYVVHGFRYLREVDRAGDEEIDKFIE